MNLRFQLDSLDKKVTQMEDAQEGKTLTSEQVDLILKVNKLEQEKVKSDDMIAKLTKRLDALEKRDSKKEESDGPVVDQLLVPTFFYFTISSLQNLYFDFKKNVYTK